MSTPLSALGRIVQPYTIDGLTHLVHAYVRNPQVSAGQWKINTRSTDANDLNWEDAADALAESLSYLMALATTPGTAELQTYASGIWTVRSTHSVALTHKAGTYIKSSQATMVLRDINFKKVKVVLIEGIPQPPSHFTTAATGFTDFDNYMKQWLSNFTVTNAPYSWQVGRGNQYLNTSGFVGFTTSLNRKIRRARGLT